MMLWNRLGYLLPARRRAAEQGICDEPRRYFAGDSREGCPP